MIGMFVLVVTYERWCREAEGGQSVRGNGIVDLARAGICIVLCGLMDSNYLTVIIVFNF